MAEQKHEQAITPQQNDFAAWYQDVVDAAGLAEHSDVKGSMVIKPYGFALWERMQALLDAKIKETGHENAYFPLLIPEGYLRKEKEHIEGFSPELAVVTHAGGKKLDEPLVIRPTSETIIYATFAKWIQSWRDLPLKINQWANVVRWELRPRLFLRTTEFLWQEGHTAHATEAEAEEEALKMLGVYQRFAEDVLAIPVQTGQKTEAERFAGALRTYTVEALMQDGKALQMGTSHNLGQNFAKVFGVQFLDEKNERQFAWQTSWGVSTRLIGALTMAHGDDKGLVLPPAIAPVQVVLIPITKESGSSPVQKAVEDVRDSLEKASIRVRVDDRDHLRIGEKFYEWEKKGVPLRIEIGPRDLEKKQATVARRDSGAKAAAPLSGIVEEVSKLLREIQDGMFAKAKAFQKMHTHEAADYATFKKLLAGGGFVTAPWCGDATCEREIADETKASIRCLPLEGKAASGSCVKGCGRDAKHRAIFARSY